MSSESISFPGISNPNPANESFYNQPYSVSFREILHGYNAFYNQLNYFDDTCRDFAQNKPLPVNYVSNTEHKVIKITKQIFSIIIFPIGIYKLVHALVGKVAILPASNLKNVANNTRLNFLPYGEWKYKRITVEVNGYKIDAVIIGKKSTLNNGRWMLASNGNGELYEDQLSHSDDFKEILSKVNSNGIVFNYPGVGASSGQPNRQAMAKAYRAMLCFLEDQDNGVGAKEIIGYGHSIGGGVQGDALKSHSLKKDVKYSDLNLKF